MRKLDGRRTGRVFMAVVALACVGAVVAACGGGGGSSGGKASSSLKGTVSVLYTNNYMFNSQALAKRWWSGIKQEFERKYPGATLKLIGTGGTDIDEMNKASLLFRSPSQTPDIIQMPTTFTSQFASSNYLLPLDKYVGSAKSAPFWSDIPKTVQDMGRNGGTLYAINNGNNDFALFYNRDMFKQAGLPADWKPKSWNDILAAARTVKQSVPNVYPIWLGAGVAAGPTNVLQGIGNLIFGSSDATMYDPQSKKWVVSSKGLTETLNFYKSVYSEGLGAPTSQLFRPDAVGQPPLLLQQKKVAIAIGANYYPTVWVDPKSQAPWPTASKDVGVTPLPTSNGQSPGSASTLGGWAVAISRASKHPDLAWAFIQMMMEPHNQLTTALWSGFVPPSTAVGRESDFVNYAPPFQAAFNNISPVGRPLPTDPNFPVYARALNTATGNIVQHPGAPVSDALKTIQDTVSQQLGPDKVETRQ
jgi:multiple sugar transport system substrate-binding protein